MMLPNQAFFKPWPPVLALMALRDKCSFDSENDLESILFFSLQILGMQLKLPKNN